MNGFDQKIRRVLTQQTIPIVELVECIIGRGHELRASDIHIDPTEKMVTIRYRIDGILQHGYTIAKKEHAGIISRIKVLANLRTDDHVQPKDGRFRMFIKDTGVFDLRLSLMPTHHGENVVARLLIDKPKDFSLETIGYEERDRELMSAALKKTSGLILVTGPTGSGKTTTLYGLLEILNKENVSIITIEDPIEYTLERVRQIQVNEKTGLTFARSLRSVLRQDPNVIMIGEIRDTETASLAVNAALTGHLVLTTLHTASAAAVEARLIDMEIPPYLLASTLTLVIGQRLVRKICQKCKTLKNIDEEEKKALSRFFPDDSLNDLVLYEGSGCDYCSQTGFRGRIAIPEILLISSKIREEIAKSVPVAVLQSMAEAEGMITMAERGLERVKDGTTTINEIIKVLYEEN